MKNWQSSYLKFFNALGRVVGYIFVVGGLFIALCGVLLLCQRKSDSFTQVVGIVIGLIVALLGFLMIKAKPSNLTEFRKKLLDKLR